MVVSLLLQGDGVYCVHLPGRPLAEGRGKGVAHPALALQVVHAAAHAQGRQPVRPARPVVAVGAGPVAASAAQAVVEAGHRHLLAADLDHLVVTGGRPQGAGGDTGAALVAHRRLAQGQGLQLCVGEDQLHPLARPELRRQQLAAVADLTQTGAHGRLAGVHEHVGRRRALTDRHARGRGLGGQVLQRRRLPAVVFQEGGYTDSGRCQDAVHEPRAPVHLVEVHLCALLAAAQGAAGDALTDDEHGAGLGEDGRRVVLGIDALEAVHGGDAEQVDALVGRKGLEFLGE